MNLYPFASDGKGHTIGMDVEPNYTYEGGYGRKTFLNGQELKILTSLKTIILLLNDL